MKSLHQPVLVDEVLRDLRVKDVALLKRGIFIDATVGLGGHARPIIENRGFVLGIEADRKSLEVAESNLNKACSALNRKLQRLSHLKNKVSCFKLIQGNFKDIDALAQSQNITRVDGILFDLGVSSYQLTSDSRGFSYLHPDSDLDMRIDQENQNVKASDLLNLLDKSQLIELFAKVIAPYKARKLSCEIIKLRKKAKIEKVKDILPLFSKKNLKREKINPATLPFMALRMAVNSEIENLGVALPKSLELLGKEGRLVVISFHSTEDRVVKIFFKRAEVESKAKILTKKPILPSEGEVKKNPRSRSAKMRVIEKMGNRN